MIKLKLKSLASLGLVVCFLLSGLDSYAETVLKDIEFSSLPGDRVEIKMTFDGKPPVPSGYTIEQPARIALDLMGVTSALGAKDFPLGNGNTRRVNVLEAGDRTRVTVVMTELVGYSTRTQDNSLYVLVGRDESFGQVAEAESSVIESTIAQSNQGLVLNDLAVIEDIDFRRGELGEGRVVVELSNPGVGVDVSSERGDIKVVFAQAHLPEGLQRRLDVSDFATPVLSIESTPEVNNVVMIVRPTGQFDYLAYQADNVFTLEVKPLDLTDPDYIKKKRLVVYTGKKMSLSFQDIEVRAVLQLLADTTEFNLVASDTVSGSITLRLKNVPWDQALDIILKTKGLDKRVDGNILMIAPAAELAAREKMELESREQIAELAPLTTEFIEVKYADAGELYGLFSSADDKASLLSERGSVIVDERTNSIILTDTAEKIEDFLAIMERLDVPVRQVLIEARIVTAASNFSEAIGVRWGILGFDRINSDKTFVQGGSSLETLDAIRGSSDNGQIALPGPGGLPDLSLSAPGDLVVDLGIGSADATSFSIGIMDEFFLLDLELSALESQGKSETIARPKVITADQQEASISSGVEIPYQEASSSGASTTSFKSATLSLQVKPQITPDDRIIMELSVTQDAIGAVFNGIPSINTNEVETKVLVNNGETIVLGGIFTTEKRKSLTKTPLLGDIPFIGRLFRRETEDESKQELLIFITPRLISDALSAR